mgnify:CR=1 FL=1
MADWYTISNAAAIPTPAVLVYPDRIQANLQRMISMAGGAERLRTHVKTHKLPQIIQMKLAAGIRKFKASTIAEVEKAMVECRAAAGKADNLEELKAKGAIA